MNTDIRLHIEFWHHAKTRRMIRHLGIQGPVSLQMLWCYAAKNRSNGELAGMDPDDIEEAAGWPLDRRGEFFTYCSRHGWLDKAGRKGWSIHEWARYNPWAAADGERSLKRQQAAHVRHHERKHVRKNDCQFCTTDSRSDACASHKRAWCTEVQCTCNAPETGNQEPVTGNQEPDTGNLEPNTKEPERERGGNAGASESVMSWPAYTARAREVSAWTKKQPPMSDEAFAAAFEAEFEFSWEQWCAIKAAMSHVGGVA